MSADSPRRNLSGGLQRGLAVPATVPPQTVSDRSILDSAIGFINDVTLVHQPITDPKDTITWARFETCADVSDPRFGDDWELEGNAAPPLLLILGYGLGVQVWAIPANGEAVEVLSWRHGVVTALRVLPTPTTASALDDNGRADEPVDAFAEKRPLVAFVDGGNAAATGLLSAGIGATTGTPIGGAAATAQFSAVNFVSLKTGAPVKTIKFKNAVLDILANRSAVAITFHERIAVFDARTLEDRLTITTCYPSPGINPNPIALGPRWMAYAEQKLLHSKRSGGGCDGEGVPSYTATVLNAAKSFGKGLRELGEQVAAGLTGTTAGSGTSSKSSSFDSATGGSDAKQSGVVTIIDVKHPIKDSSSSGTPLGSATSLGGSGSSGDPIVAHFIAHSDALVAMEFDSSGMLLLTADRRGHDFHVFRIQPHPVGASLASVHHLYVLHRGDTSAKVQHIAFSLDSRWAAVSTLRGTTHVFPITPYGGAMGVRTHTSLHVVNKLSRFHRSAGLGADGRSSSPISHSESTTFVQSLQPYHNPTLPPFPRPSVVQPLAQLRQPFTLGSQPGTATLTGAAGGSSGAGTGGTSQRQRLSSLSDDNGKPLSVCAIFAKSRSWLLEPPTATREAPHRMQRKAVDSLFVMAGHGALIQYDLDTKLASNVAKEKICDDTPIELEVEAKAQWNLGRRKDGSQEIIPPLSLDNWLIKDRHASLLLDSAHQIDEPDERAESWLAQVEIITHAGPHRRLWMGPQFVFKNYNTPSGSNLNHVDAEAVEIGVTKATTTLPSTPNALASTPSSLHGSIASATIERSSPLNMPLSAVTQAAAAAARGGVPVLIESGSYSSIEQSPKLMDRFRHGHMDSDYGHGDTRLKEDLADAMRESPSTAAARRETGAGLSRTLSQDPSQDSGTTGSKQSVSDNAYYYDALAEHDYEDEELEQQGMHEQEKLSKRVPHSSLDCRSGAASAAATTTAAGAGGKACGTDAAAVAALASVLPNICSYEQVQPSAKIEKIVNPLGTVTTVTAGLTNDVRADMLDEVVGQLAAEDCVIHENCDEALFRPVVAIFCDGLAEQRKHEQQLQLQAKNASQQHGQVADDKPPSVLVNKLIVPVIAKEVDEALCQKEKQKSGKLKSQTAAALAAAASAADAAQAQKFAELSNLNKPAVRNSSTVTSGSTKSQSKANTLSEDDRELQTEDELQSSTLFTASIATKPSKKSKAAKQKTTNKQQQHQLERSTSSTMEDSLVEQKPLESSVELITVKSNKKDKKSVKQVEALDEPDLDYAGSLLANKTSIAAVVLNSASDKGTEEKTVAEKEEEPKKSLAELDVELEKPTKADGKSKAVSKSKTIEIKLEKSKEKEEKEKPKENEEKPKEIDEKCKSKAITTESLEACSKAQTPLTELKTKETKPTIAEQLKEEKRTKNLEKDMEAETLKMNDAREPKSYTVKVIEEQPIVSSSPSGKRTSKLAPTANVWKSMGGAELLCKSSSSSTATTTTTKHDDYPCLAASPNRKLAKPSQLVEVKAAIAEKILPSLPMPLEPEEFKMPLKAIGAQQKLPSSSRKDGSNNFEDFLTALKPLAALPPFPALEPLEVLAKSTCDTANEQPSSEPTLSLINFESPLQENVVLPRGYTDKNLIFALCGSLHYENEYAQLPAVEAETEAGTTPETPAANSIVSMKYTSTSNNSSGSEEIIVMEEHKKLNKKHKRAKQREMLQQQQEKLQQQKDQAAPDDEELRPLISMSDSQLEVEIVATVDDDEPHTLPEDLLHFGSSGCNNLNADACSLAQSSTTTDSEGPIPATTSDDNAVYMLPFGSTSSAAATPHKLKTKKLEHKINLIAAIEAATSSSSTSSAEESSVETSGNPSASILECGNAAAGIDIGLGAAVTTLPLPSSAAIAASSSVAGSSQASATKKKTKRRKR